MIISFVCLLILINSAKEISSLSCLDMKKDHETSCLASESDNYLQCMKQRIKRHFHDCDFDDDCSDCDCNSCSYSKCEGECDQCCNACCTNYVQCHTNHCCHRQCHSECRTYNCRNACRKGCFQSVERENVIREKAIEKVVATDGGSTAVHDAKSDNVNRHNITTIINLKNVLNNTNFLDVPINLTYTNKNNITLNEAVNALRNGANGGDNCCIVIGPRQCVPIQVTPFVRCFHTRSRQCSSFCTSDIVHEASRQICNSMDSFGQPANCQQQKTYVPQPQPRCTYTSTWPYVACGIQTPAACEGCYGHYFNPQLKQYQNCPAQCYDDFSIGPLYRQGPFYQPGYSHVPPCTYSSQGCLGSGFGSMGGYVGGAYGPAGFGYNQGFGGAAGYAFPPGLPMQPNWYAPFIEPSFNATTLNQTLLDKKGLMDAIVFTEYRDGVYAEPFNQGVAKEVEMDVDMTTLDENGQAKRDVKEYSREKKDIYVETV